MNYYLILELIEGRTLADELATRGAPGLPETDVLTWAISLCDALAYLHGHTPPVIFRDLKPQNIMRRLDGRVVLIDFGIARAMTTAGGTAIGTGGYAPPEQYQGLADVRSDVYGLAATLHHLLTGRDPTRHPPFRFPPVQELVPQISLHINSALAHALNMAPDDRFQTANAFAAALIGTQSTLERPAVNYQPTVAGAAAPGLPPSAWPLPAITMLDSNASINSAAAVTLRDLLTSNAWTQERASLALPLGMDTLGAEVIVDLTKAPHLLIAGAGHSRVQYYL